MIGKLVLRAASNTLIKNDNNFTILPSKPGVTGSSPVGRANVARMRDRGFNGGCSSAGRVPDCDSGCRGLESHQPPQNQRLRTCAGVKLSKIILDHSINFKAMRKTPVL